MDFLTDVNFWRVALEVLGVFGFGVVGLKGRLAYNVLSTIVKSIDEVGEKESKKIKKTIKKNMNESLFLEKELRKVIKKTINK